MPPGAGPVQLTIYNAAGQMVRILVDRPLGPGRHRIPWDGRDGGGTRVSSGIYFYRMQTAQTAQTRGMTLLK